MIYKDIENKMEFGYTENGDYLLYKDDKEYVIDQNISLLTKLLPLLEIDINVFKQSFESNGLNFEEIFPLEKLVLSAFDDGFGNSTYWKELALTWLEKLDYRVPSLIRELRVKADSLPQNIQHRIFKLSRKYETNM